MASLSSFRYISFSLLGQGPLPREARAPAGLGADQGCGLAGNPAAQPLNLPSRRTRILLALGQASDHVRKCCGRSLFGGPRGTARTAHECAHALPARKPATRGIPRGAYLCLPTVATNRPKSSTVILDIFMAARSFSSSNKRLISLFKVSGSYVLS